MKNLLSSIIFLSLTTFTSLNAQLQNNIWYFGATSGINFPSGGGAPTQIPTSPARGAFTGGEGCGVATNPISGQVMFYTDGISIYNANNEPMSNSPVGGLGGCNSSAQAVAFCQVPDECNQYYVFTNGACSNTNLYAYIVDMNALGGLGEVRNFVDWDWQGLPVPSSNILHTGISESMTIIPIPGTPNFWLVGRIANQTKMFSFEIDADFRINFDNDPVPSENLNIATTTSYNMEYCANALSPLKNVAIAYPNAGKIYTLGFDVSTGLFSNGTLLNDNVGGVPYDVEWSPNGQMLYYSTYTNFIKLVQDDLSGTVTDIYTFPGQNSSGGGLKTGPDGKIYFIYYRGYNNLVVVNNPDSPGSSCNYSELDFQGDSFWDGLNLPVTLPPATITNEYAYDLCSTASGITLSETVLATETIQWLSSSGTSLATTADLTVNPSVTTVYYAVITITATGCQTVNKHTVTIIDPVTISASASATVFCAGDAPVVITPSGGGPYTVVSSSGTTTNYAGSFSVTPSATTTYSITNQNGCSNTVVITINDCLCTGGTEIGTNGSLPASIFGPNIYLINNDITLTGNVTFNNSEVRIAPGVQITVPNGKAFNIIQSSHLYACNKMWDGIDVQAGGKISISGVSATGKPALIEDAKTAINFNGGGALNLPLVTRHTIFNRNNIGINITNATPTAAFTIRVENTVFTCRRMPTSVYAQWSSVSSLTMSNLKTVNTGSGTTALDDRNISDLTYPLASLKAPFLTLKSAAGIILNNVGTTTNPTTVNPSYITLTLGNTTTAEFNLFDNYNVGIYATNSNVRIINSKFQNAVSDGNTTVPIAVKGKGIYAATAQGAKKQFELTTSEFTNCHVAVEVNNYFSNDVINNIIKSTQTTTTDYFSTVPHKGSNGIWIKSNQYRRVFVDNNRLYNIEKGIIFNSVFGAFLIGGFVPTTNTNYKYKGQVDITNNTLRSNFAGDGFANPYLKEAIITDNIAPAPNTGDSSMLANSTVNVSKNHIYDAFRGIMVRNWHRQKVLIESNIPINLNEETIAGAPQLQYGIYYVNNVGIAPTMPVNPFTDTRMNSVFDNTVNGFTNDNNTKQAAILTASSANQRVKCNRTFNSYHGIKFDHTNLNTFFITNEMTTHHYAFVLDQNGKIGPQYVIYYFLNLPSLPYYQPFDNSWLGNNTFKTAVLNSSSASNSIFYVRNNTFYPQLNPVGSSFAQPPLTPGVDDYYYNSSNTGNLRYASTNPPIAPLLQCNSGTLITPNIQYGSEQLLLELEKIARNEIAYVEKALETKTINEHQLFKVLDQNPELMVNSADLQNFYSNSQTNNRQKVKNTDIFIAQSAYAAADQEIASIIEDNPVDMVYKSYYSLYSRLEQDSIVSTTDSISLLEIAKLCPFTFGSCIYQARALYSSLYNYPITFDNVCDNLNKNLNSKQENASKNNITDKEPNGFVLYPNPNNGSFYINDLNHESKTISVKIYDLSGKIVFEEKMESNGEILSVDSRISNGIYSLKITNIDSDENYIYKIWVNN